MFLTDNPQRLVLDGKIADVPIVAGTLRQRMSDLRVDIYTRCRQCGRRRNPLRSWKNWFNQVGNFLRPLFCHYSNCCTRNNADFESWINSTWLPDATDSDRESVFVSYTEDATEGSPFATGSLNQYKNNTQYKRVAAFQGDLVFQAPRRFLVQTVSNLPDHQSKIWVYRTCYRYCVYSYSADHPWL